MEAASFLRELVAYYTLLESSSAVSLAAASEPPKDSYISLLSLDAHNDRASSVTGASGYCMPIDSHSFTNGLGTPCTLYGTMVTTLHARQNYAVFRENIAKYPYVTQTDLLLTL